MAPNDFLQFGMDQEYSTPSCRERVTQEQILAVYTFCSSREHLQDVAWLTRSVLLEDGTEFLVPQWVRLQLRKTLVRQYQEQHAGTPLQLSESVLYVLFDIFATKDIKARAGLDTTYVEGILLLVLPVFHIHLSTLVSCSGEKALDQLLSAIPLIVKDDIALQQDLLAKATTLQRHLLHEFKGLVIKNDPAHCAVWLLSNSKDPNFAAPPCSHSHPCCELCDLFRPIFDELEERVLPDKEHDEADRKGKKNNVAPTVPAEAPPGFPLLCASMCCL